MRGEFRNSKLTAKPLVLANELIFAWRRKAAERIEQDIRERGIRYPDRGFAESLRLTILHEATIDMYRNSFHVCAALRLRDGRWVLIDGNTLDWGPLSPVWGMRRIHGLLTRYGTVLPGLAILGSDEQTPETLFAEEMAAVDALLSRSQQMEDGLKDAKTPTDIVDWLTASPELDFIYRHFVAAHGKTTELALSHPQLRQYLAATLVFGTNPEENMFTQYFEFMRDPEWLKKRVDTLLTVYHCMAGNRFRNQLTDDGRLVHSVCEFALPEHEIAMAVVNSLCGQWSSEAGNFFLAHAFDQLVLHNALLGLGQSRLTEEQAIARAAASALHALPFVHSLTRRRLAIFGEK